MPAANTRYDGLSGNAGFQGLAYATEKLLESKWELLSERRLPLLKKIQEGKTNFNTVAKSGPKMLLPVWDNAGPAAQSADGVYPGYLAGAASSVTGRLMTAAGQYTPQRIMINDGTQAEFLQAEYTAAMGITEREVEEYVNSGTARRASLVEGRTAQLMDDFQRQIAADLGTATVGTTAKLMGLGWIVATANVVGNIDQATATRWQSLVQTAAGWTRSDLNKFLRRMGDEKNSDVDLILFSSSSGSNDNWEKFVQMFDDKTLIMNAGKTQDWGADVYMYRGRDACWDWNLPDNNIFFLNTKKMYWSGSVKPRNIDTGGGVRVAATTATISHYQFLAGLAGYPNAQGKWTAAS